ncbi:hypothetical protein CTRI78_v012142 [Colletotrichum trifolii]|uniref:CFEM domain-containing protein n=1 Tax=Colletotrichum trifolii TaxID=5466 RepID=A0A4R8PRZ3_COLTR|nr:hypothetical protein CTRI78_v012142 [Colletotrichum trifolii]
MQLTAIIVTLAIGVAATQTPWGLPLCAVDCLQVQVNSTGCPIENPRLCLCDEADRLELIDCVVLGCDQADAAKAKLIAIEKCYGPLF